MLFLTTFLKSQKADTSISKYWLDVGIGGYTVPTKSSGLTFNLGANYLPGNTLYKIRFLGNQECFSNRHDQPSESYYNVGLLIGLGSSNEYSQFYLAAGLGLTKGLKQGKFLYTEEYPNWPFWDWEYNHFKEDSFITFSIPMEMDFF